MTEAARCGWGRTAPLALVLLATIGCDRSPPEPQPSAVVKYAGWPELSGRVVDLAHVLTPEQEKRLSAKSEALEKELGPQFVVVTVPSLNGLPIDDYSLQLARHWGVGHKQRNDGLMLLVAPEERKVRIEVGTGLERRITNAFAAKVIDEQALPSFGGGNLPEGIAAAADALVARLRLQADERRTPDRVADAA